MPTAYGEARERLTRRLVITQRAASLALVLLGLTVICGWVVFHTGITLRTGLATTKFNTALGLILSGLALYGLGPDASERAWARARWFAGGVILLGALTLLQYPLKLDFGIDNLFYSHPHELFGAPGRMSGFTASAFVVLGIAIWIDADVRIRRSRNRNQWPVIVLFLIGLLGLLGVIYHAPRLLNFIPGFGIISLLGAIGILTAALALALVRPGGNVGSLLVSPSSAGTAARNMLFGQIGFLLVFIVANVAMEHAGLLDKGEAAAVRNFAIFSVLLISGWKALARLDQADTSLRGSLLEVEAARANLEGNVALRTAELAATSLRAEAARAQLESVMASTPAMVAAVDRDLRFTVINEAYAASVLEYQGIVLKPGMHYHEIFVRSADYREQGETLWRRALAGERFITISMVPQQNGTDAVYERSFGPIIGGDGQVVGAVGLLRDVTEQQAMARALEKERRLLDGIMTHGDAAIFVKDAQGRYLIANPRYGRMLGRPVDELVGLTDADLLAPALASVAHATDEFVLREKQPHQREVKLDVPGEGVRHYLISKVPIPAERDGEWLVCGMSLDITERKEAEAALEEAAHHLRVTLDSAQVGLWDWDISSGSLVLDRNWQVILGYGPEALPHTVDSWRATIHPDDARAVQKRLEAHLKDPAVPYEVVYRARHKNGEWIWVSSRGSVTERDTEERPLRMTGVIADIHRLKEAEAMIHERNRDLETLLHVTSHDLREPLRAIESFSRMTRERYAGQLDASGQDYLDRVIRAAGRMNGLIDDIMRLSKARRAKVAPEPVDAGSLIEEVRGRLEQRIHETGARIIIDPDLPALIVDRSWATQALYNLVANGLKYPSSGQAPEITITGYHAHGEVGLVVADRGPGVDPEHRERIFELFQRAVGRDVEGSGAGLAIVAQVAARHHGRAWMQPREGGGSEFVITFHSPAEAAARPALMKSLRD